MPITTICAIAAIVLVAVAFAPALAGWHRYAQGKDAQDSGVQIL